MMKLTNPNVYFYEKLKPAKLLGFYAVLLLCFAPISFTKLDTFYYLAWSKALALSYFDGPPLIAYVMRGFTFLMGDSQFALNIMGLSLTGLTAWALYRTALLCLSRDSSLIAVGLWLFAPITTLSLINLTSYDNLQALFWVSTQYCVIRYIQTDRWLFLYLTGVSIGLLLLSKYTGIVLVLGLLVFLTVSRYRFLFKSPHFYAALAIAFCLFSPVLIWNYQHDWLSFRFMLNVHAVKGGSHGLWKGLSAPFTRFLPALNLFLFTPIICWRRQYHKQSPVWCLCLVISTVFVLFYWLVSFKAVVRPLWLAPYLISTVLLAGQLHEKGAYLRLFHYLIIGSLILSLLIVFNNNPWLYVGKTSNRPSYYLMKQFNEDYPAQPDIVLAPNWLEARAFYHLSSKQSVYTLPCGGQGNQYGLWSQEIQEALRQRKIKQALYIDFTHRFACVKRYFDSCQRLPTRPYWEGKVLHELYAYHCENSNAEG